MSGEGTLPADADDPGYKQLGDEGNPFTGDDNTGEAVNPPLPDQGPSDGTDEEAVDQVPGDH